LALSIASLAEGLEKLMRKFEADMAHHERLVALVERMPELNKQKAHCSAGLRPAVAAHRAALQPSELDRLVREIASTDAEIDELVYALYGITEEERGIIAGA
jgi:hypothetical protein